jgi:hypothetical protein
MSTPARPMDLVIVRTFISRIDAELARSALEACQIDSMVAADDAGGERPGLNRVRLMVRAEDAQAAHDILGPT